MTSFPTEIPVVPNFHTSILIIFRHTILPYHELWSVLSDIYSLEDLIVNEKKISTSKPIFEKKVTEDVLRIKLTEYMFHFPMFVNALIFWQPV